MQIFNFDYSTNCFCFSVHFTEFKFIDFSQYVGIESIQMDEIDLKSLFLPIWFIKKNWLNCSTAANSNLYVINAKWLNKRIFKYMKLY